MKRFKIPWKLCFGILGVFVAGMITSVLLIGILVAKESERGSANPQLGEQRLLRQMTRVLELDEQQQEEVAPILADVVTETRSEIGKVVDSHSTRVREILTPEQNQRFSVLLQKVEGNFHVQLQSKDWEETVAQPESEEGNSPL